MLILLPPSETKRPGGDGPKLDLRALAHPTLTAQRRAVVSALTALSADEDAAARVLKLGPTQRHEIAVNRAVRRSPTMAAVDRYTGVLYDALDAASLSSAARAWVGDHVHIHSAPFGPVAALDPVPAYRLPAGVSIPGLPPLRRVWADAVSAALARTSAPFVLDLRSEAYTALGPVPVDLPSAYVRVVTEARGGATRALNHFNKRSKGVFVRALAQARPDVATVADLIAWAATAGFRLRSGAESGEVELLETAEMLLSRGESGR